MLGLAVRGARRSPCREPGIRGLLAPSTTPPTALEAVEVEVLVRTVVVLAGIMALVGEGMQVLLWVVRQNLAGVRRV